MKYSVMIIFIIANVCCAKTTERHQIQNHTKLINIDKILSDSQMIKEIQADFDLAVNGAKPKFAKLESGLLDGGTPFYKGKGYLLTIVKSIGRLGGVEGYYYGPIIKFKEDENIKVMSNVSFYSKDKLDVLLKQR